MKKEELDLREYIGIYYSEICEDYDLLHGDISPSQQNRIDEALDEVNKVLNEFINQNVVYEEEYEDMGDTCRNGKKWSKCNCC